MKSFLRSFSSLLLNHSRRVVVSYKQKYVHKVLVNCLFKLVQEKVWLGELTVAVDLGRKATKKKKIYVKSLIEHMSRDVRFPTMWYKRPAKPHISLHIRTV